MPDPRRQLVGRRMKVYMCSHLALCVNGILQIIG